MREPFLRPFGDEGEWCIDRGDGIVVENGSKAWCERRLPQLRVLFHSIRRQCRDAALRRAIAIMGEQ